MGVLLFFPNKGRKTMFRNVPTEFDKTFTTKENGRSICLSWGDCMEHFSALTIDETAMNHAVIEVKLAVNRKLYERKAITEEMYIKAKDMILRGS
jgi:hypothetical protein